MQLKNLKFKYWIDAAVIAVAILLAWSGTHLIEKLPYLPIQEWSDLLITWLNKNLGPLFDTISFIISSLIDPIHFVLLAIPPTVMVILAILLGYRLNNIKMGAFFGIALMIISAMGYWEQAMVTLSLVLTAALLALVAGIPLGIAKAHSKIFGALLDPALDFMQTMPLFVYLIPAVLFFSIGNIPGVVATFIFATPPAVRLTSLGIEQISEEMLEVGKAFGSSAKQLLLKVEFPLAMPSIIMGINQTIMLSLSMVVVASMIGAEGLGQEVLRGIMRLQVGQGIAGGLGIVLLAMILDRFTRQLWKAPK